MSHAEMVLAAALEYAAAGWPVFWIEEGSKRPAPVAIHGFKSAVTSAERLRATMPRGLPNLALATGYPGPADVLDVEGHRKPGGSGWAAFNALKAAGLLGGAFRLVRTPSEGLHAYYAGTFQRSGSVKTAHIDFKAGGGYVLLPPSQVGGRRYEVIADRPWNGSRLDWAACKRLLSPPAPYRAPRRGGSAKHLVKWLQGELEGNRNNALYWACLRALESGDEAVVTDLADIAVSAGLGQDEVRKTVNSAVRTVNGE